MPFLSVVTRCYQRPRMLLRNITSLARQSCHDFEQIFLVDTEGRGVEWANGNLQAASDRIRGEYVLILDDDDCLLYRNAVIELKELVEAQQPHVVVFRADHGRLGVLPDEHVWRGEPKIGHIGSCDFIVRADLWRHCIWAFGVRECGDYRFLIELWKQEPDVIWYDRVLAGVQRISRGKPEPVSPRGDIAVLQSKTAVREGTDRRE